MLDCSHGEGTTVFLLHLGSHGAFTNGINIHTTDQLPLSHRGPDMMEWFFLAGNSLSALPGQGPFQEHGGTLPLEHIQVPPGHCKTGPAKAVARDRSQAPFDPEDTLHWRRSPRPTPMKPGTASVDSSSTLDARTSTLKVIVAPRMFQRRMSLWAPTTGNSGSTWPKVHCFPLS